jgi:hypothetical protein
MAKLRLEISQEEVERRTKEYESLTGRHKPRLGLKKWMAREISSALSKATSIRGGYAVADTLRPIIEAELEVLGYAKETHVQCDECRDEGLL